MAMEIGLDGPHVGSSAGGRKDPFARSLARAMGWDGRCVRRERQRYSRTAAGVTIRQLTLGFPKDAIPSGMSMYGLKVL